MSHTQLKALSLAFLLFALTATAVAAEDFTVDIEPVKNKVTPSEGGSAVFNINIKNNGANRSFKIGINTGTASGPGWYYLDKSIQSIKSNQTSSAQLQVTPDIGAVAGNVGPEIVVYPLGEPDNSFSELITFSILRNNRIALLGIDGLKDKYGPDESIDVSVQLKNVIQRDLPANEYQIYFELNDQNLTAPVPSIESGETKNIQTGMNLDNHEAGIYDLKVALQTIDGEVRMEKSAKIEIGDRASTTREKTVSKGLLTSTTTFKVKNDGNTVVNDIKVEEDVPWYLEPFTTFENQELRSEDVEGKQVWIIESLKPGETAEITYQTNYWPPVIVLLLLVIVATVIYQQLRRVKLSKTGKVAGDNYSIHLRVENRTGKVMERTKLEDFVPGIASLVPEFESRKPEKIQKTEEGTKMVWSLGRMEPGEERIITYKLKPKVKVEGETRLPDSTLRYHISGERYSESSYPISAKFS